jgi:hypothetical protein
MWEVGETVMYFKAFEALEPKDLLLLRSVLAEVCAAREIDLNDRQVEIIGQELIDLWLSGFRTPDELQAMLKPL